MRVVQLNCVFGHGSTGKIVEAIHRHLVSEGDESYVLYGYGPDSSDPCAIRVVPPVVRKAQSLRSRVTGFPYGGALWGTRATINELKALRPDVAHIHCFNAYIANIYSILSYLKSEGIPTIITNHAEFMYTGGCTHALQCEKWLYGCGGCERIGKEHPISWFFDRTHKEWEFLKEAYDGFDNLTVCCVSDWVRERAAQSPFFKGRQVLTVLNGLDPFTFRYRSNQSLREDLSAGRRKVIMHVTPDFSSPIKGGRYVLAMAERMPDVSFVIVGDRGGAKSELKNVRFVGRANDQTRLAEYYSAADICLLTSERETYSMVTAESLCCGTPVVGFRAGGPESIAITDYSDFVQQGSIDELEHALKRTLDAPINKQELSSTACSLYGEHKMCSRYRELYQASEEGRPVVIGLGEPVVTLGGNRYVS